MCLPVCMHAQLYLIVGHCCTEWTADVPVDFRFVVYLLFPVFYSSWGYSFFSLRIMWKDVIVMNIFSYHSTTLLCHVFSPYASSPYVLPFGKRLGSLSGSCLKPIFCISSCSFDVIDACSFRFPSLMCDGCCMCLWLCTVPILEMAAIASYHQKLQRFIYF